MSYPRVDHIPKIIESPYRKGKKARLIGRNAMVRRKHLEVRFESICYECEETGKRFSTMETAHLNKQRINYHAEQLKEKESNEKRAEVSHKI